MQACPDCGEENPDRFRLCGFCGTVLAPAEPRQTARRTVTIVFSDLKGSTSLGEQLDSESLWEVLRVYFEAMKAVLERHGGTVEKYIGDAIMAVFGLPQVHEDDALRAVRAALEMQTALVEVNNELVAGWGVTLENRTGVNTGEVVTGDPAVGQRLVTGDTVNLAARLEQSAAAGEVLLGEATYRLVQHAARVETLEPLTVKGKSEAVPAYRLLGVHGDEAITRRVDTPMVGREHDLAALMDMFGQAVESGTCHAATIVGLAGLGKSRLVAELVRGLDAKATILQGRCLSYGDGTFWPLADVVRQATGISSDDTEPSARSKLTAIVGEGRADAADRLASVMGLSAAVYGLDETQWATRTFFEALARRHPVVVVFDDIHWAEPTFLDLLEDLVDLARSTILVVCASRPELLEDRPGWMREHERSRQILLGELSVADSIRVVRNLLGDAGIPETLEVRILEAAEGNPLFVEQMIGMLVDDGVLVEQEDGRWGFADRSAPVLVPGSIASLLAARLDRLLPHERSVLERGSVVGQVFYPSAVQALADGEHDDDVSTSLAALARKRLVTPVESDIDIVGGNAYQFVHILVRDAAYRGVLKRARAALHERFGDWLEMLAGPGLTEYEEIVGYHLEQAFHYCTELRRPGAKERLLGERAAAHLRPPGERALARGDLPAAASLLHRAAELLSDDDRGRPRLLLEVGDAFTEMGELARADAVLGEAVARADGLNDSALGASARLALLYLRYSTDPQAVEAEVVKEAASAIDAFGDPEDHDVLGRAWRLLLRVHHMASMSGPAERAVEETIRHAEARGDDLTARRLLGALALSALYGPRPVSEAIARCEMVLAGGASDRKVTALAQCALARLEAMRGEFAHARILYRQSRGILEEFGWSLLAALTSIDSGPIEMLAGDPVAAEGELRRDYETLQAMDERNYISTVAGLLASAVYEQGRFDEADELARTAAELGAPDDVSTQYIWRCVRAKVLARRGHFAEAEALAVEAAGIIDGTDDLDAQGSALLDLAEVHRLAGNDGEQASVLTRAAELFGRKGNTVSLAKAQLAQDRLATLSR